MNNAFKINEDVKRRYFYNEDMIDKLLMELIDTYHSYKRGEGTEYERDIMYDRVKFISKILTT